MVSLVELFLRKETDTSILYGKCGDLHVDPGVDGLCNFLINIDARGVTDSMYAYDFPFSLILDENWRSTLSCSCLHVIIKDIFGLFCVFSFRPVQMCLL